MIKKSVRTQNPVGTQNFAFPLKKAFTLVELLVVIVIIGVLATLAVVALQQARSSARDSKRMADIKQTQTALELFFNEYNRYPTEEEWINGTLVSPDGYMLMQDIPIAPKTVDGECDPNQNNYYYEPNEDYSSYTLSFCLGKSVSNLSEGPKCATPGGILDYDCSGEYINDGSGSSGGGDTGSNVCYPSCDYGYICQNGSCIVDTFECGQELTYNGYTYQTIGIGTQCWFKENLQTDKFKNGDSIPNVTTQWNITGGVGPAWAHYNNDSVYENSYGKLYSVYAALDPRDICPDGWRTPTRVDFQDLVSAVSPHDGFSLQSCRMVNSPLGGDCSTDQHPRWNYSSTYIGTDIFGFSALPGGYLRGSRFYNLGSSGHFWTTTPYQTTRLYDGRAVNNASYGFGTSIGDTYFDSGRSVRCIKE